MKQLFLGGDFNADTVSDALVLEDSLHSSTRVISTLSLSLSTPFPMVSLGVSGSGEKEGAEEDVWLSKGEIQDDWRVIM